MELEDFILREGHRTLQDGNVIFKVPSNIALVKYWGKKDGQIPANPSISFTLNNCATTTELGFTPMAAASASVSFDFRFEGKPKPSFIPKMETFFERILRYVPFLTRYHLTINSSNSFPHSSGVASSASAMGALASCIVEMERMADGGKEASYYHNKASFLARLGSGSASRSLQGPLVHWGRHAATTGSSDLYAIPYPNAVHPIFENFHDTILLVDKGVKQVSSTVGHDLMHGHPFAEQRFQQAHDHLDRLAAIFETGDMAAFIRIVESEALTCMP